MNAFANNPAAMLGMHDGAALIERRAAVRAAFAQMLIAASSPSDADLQQVLLFELHARNVELFGWRDAEALRGEAFAEAVQAHVPAGEATDSDFGAFDAARGGSAEIETHR